MPTLNISGTKGPMFVEPNASSRISVWFAIQTRPRYEKKVATKLEEKNLEVFLPMLASKHKWSDRQRTVQMPLFPSYLFVRIPQTKEARIAVLSTNGATSFVGVRGAGIMIPEVEMESVRTVLAQGISVQAHSFLTVGDRVRVRGGSLDGVEGILLAKNDDLSLVVSIKAIQRSLSIRIAGYQVVAA
jgi:transcriptional antiterminator NusG